MKGKQYSDAPEPSEGIKEIMNVLAGIEKI